MEKNEIRDVVQKKYGEIASKGTSCCSPTCCGSDQSAEAISGAIGYSSEEMSGVPEGANLGLGCGNPVALASIKEGDVVLDLGSGAGFDAFLAARKVGAAGRVIGVDMTDEMLARARENAEKGGFANVEFRKGAIEELPVDDDSVDLIISNCVINLSPEKEKVFAEAYRVLKPGGRIMISDLVLLGDLPEALRDSIAAYVGCIAGAMLKDSYLQLVRDAGFSDISLIDESAYPVEFAENDPVIKGVMETFSLTPEEVKHSAEVVASLKFSAMKE